jgi:acyl-CoA reductase-like NAD-dependent aldehyde dehydrogenase
MSVSAPSPATHGVASRRAPAGLPEDSFGAYNESSCGREMGHNGLEKYFETKSVVTRLA